MDNEKNILPEGAPGNEGADETAVPSIFDKPDYSAQKPPKKKKFSRQTRTIIVSVVVCAALALGAFAINRVWPKGSDDSVSSTESEITTNYIFDYSSYANSPDDTDTLKLGGVSSITSVNGDTVMKLSGVMATSKTIDPSTLEEVTRESMNWSFDSISTRDIEGVRFKSSYVGFIPSTLLHMPYESIYAEDRNAEIPQGGKNYFEECGFNNSTVSQTVEFADGSSIKVLVGDKTPTDNNRFVCLDVTQGPDPTLAGVPQIDNRIYAVTEGTLAYFLKEPEYYVENQLIDAAKDETTYGSDGTEIPDKYFMSGKLTYFDDISVRGTNFKSPLRFATGEVEEPPYATIYRMILPYEQNVDTTAMDLLMAPVAEGLTAEKCMVMKASAADASRYGLDNPICSVAYTVKNKTSVVHIGKEIDPTAVESNLTASDLAGVKYYAVSVDGNPSIYAITADSVKFVDMDETNYANSMVYSCNIDLIKTMTVTLDGKTTEFVLTHTPIDGDSESTELSVTADGRGVNTAMFREMYADILSLNSFAHVDDGVDAASPYLTIRFTYDDYDRTDTLRFSPYTDRRYFMSLNGHGTSVVLSTALDSFKSTYAQVVG